MSKHLPETVIALLDDRPDVCRFAIGKNAETRKLMEHVSLSGIIDDSRGADSRWNGVPLLRADEIPERSIVVNCASSIAPVSAARRLAEAGCNAVVLKYSDLVASRPDLFLPADFVTDMRSNNTKFRAKWDALRSRLEDEESRMTMDAIVSYRLTGDYDHLSSYPIRLTEQYFDPLVRFSTGEVFADCGAFDGDTTEEFCKRCPDYQRVWLFEPAPDNLAKARARLNGRRDLAFVAEGVSDKSGILRFDANAGSASAVRDTAETRIAVTTLDEAVADPISFIKMDLEGWELNALVGAREHIRRNHPKMAIAVYHRAEDFWRIPEFILGIRNDYDIALRHYTEGWSESVMYFTPKSNEY